MSHSEYLSERKVLIDHQKSSAFQHDKSLLSLTMASLGVSITFLDKIAPDPTPSTTWILAASWIALLASVAACLGSYHLSHKTVTQQIEILTSEFRDQKLHPEQPRAAIWEGRVNLFAYTAFVVGIGLIGLFCWGNL